MSKTALPFPLVFLFSWLLLFPSLDQTHKCCVKCFTCILSFEFHNIFLPLFIADSLPVPGIPERECSTAIIEIKVQGIWFGTFLKLGNEKCGHTSNHRRKRYPCGLLGSLPLSTSRLPCLFNFRGLHESINL